MKGRQHFLVSLKAHNESIKAFSRDLAQTRFVD